MKAFFAVTLCVLGGLSGVAWLIQPKLGGEGKIPLTWVSDDNPARKEQISLFNELHPGHDLRLDPTNTGMQKVIVQSLAGVGPDLFCCYDGFQLSAYVRSGIAWDVTDELAKAGIDPKRDAWSGAHPNCIHEGRVYGFPDNASVDCIWINKDIFRKLGLPLPTGKVTRTDSQGRKVEEAWRWIEDFIPLAEKLTPRDADGRAEHFGFLFQWWAWRHFILQWGGRVFTPDGTRCVVDCPGTISAIQFMQDLIYKYRVSPSPAEEAMASKGGWGAGTIQWFAGEKAAMALGGRWWLCTLRKQTHPGVPAGATEAQKQEIERHRLKLTAVLSPRQTYQRYSGYGRATLINSESPRRREALEFLKYLAGREFSELINRQADALAPVKKFCYTEKYLHNPEFPEEDYNAVWREAMDYGVPNEVSPFVNGNAAMRILNRQLDLVKNNSKSAADAMKTAARQVNEEIQKTLQRDPSLRKQYEEVMRKGAE